MRRVALVGAGFIARVHADALQAIPGLSITAIIDPRQESARALARDYGGPPTFSSLEQALAADMVDAAHVLVPPDLHAPVAGMLIAAGKALLVEKPLADTAEACEALVRKAEASGVPLGVNQNFLHHPAFKRLLSTIRSSELGRATHVTCIYSVPLRQIAARQFGHWMFASARNLLLEQAVHPLSQLARLAGEIKQVQVMPGPPLELPEGQIIYPSFDALLRCDHLPVSLRFAVGQAYPLWQISVVCDDGVAVADILSNRFYTQQRSQFLDAVDGVLSSTHTAAAQIGSSLRNATGYGLSLLHLKPRSDAFYLSMRDSIASFHSALDAGHAPELDGRFGASLVGICERIAAQLAPAAAVPKPAPGAVAPDRSPDLAILGGTGFIGTHLVRLCLERNLRVSVMARSLRGLPDLFRDPRVSLHKGDIRVPADVAATIGGVQVIINLAHGGGGSSWEEVREAMVGGAETVARACLDAQVKRLVHVGSIAGLYLGPQSKPVTGATPPDPQAERRADYARAKAVCDRLLLAMHAREGLPVVILRPGIVVGEGGPPFHGGLGFFNNDQHCIGWNDGRNPLPFVLVEDVADAILRATEAEGVTGRCYNIVGDVRLSARDYIAALGAAMQRPLKFHPQSPLRLWAAELGKWGIKRAGGRRAPLPSLHDLLSRGMRADFDCTDAKRDLGWTPVADRGLFEARAIGVHAT